MVCRAPSRVIRFDYQKYGCVARPSQMVTILAADDHGPVKDGMEPGNIELDDRPTFIRVFVAVPFANNSQTVKRAYDARLKANRFVLGKHPGTTLLKPR